MSFTAFSFTGTAYHLLRFAVLGWVLMSPAWNRLYREDCLHERKCNSDYLNKAASYEKKLVDTEQLVGHSPEEHKMSRLQQTNMNSHNPAHTEEARTLEEFRKVMVHPWKWVQSLQKLFSNPFFTILLKYPLISHRIALFFVLVCFFFTNSFLLENYR